ncbi:hypothetical protein DF185_20895 [Marinifilum breve]|uniref:Uncharacterized protein n=1 Tax=Marinifilum breve TaxID=2184082 RepID=A0A2V3ZR00_9BACT|nr:hypothetical protein DF185_20895 [Marinifilum breve]
MLFNFNESKLVKKRRSYQKKGKIAIENRNQMSKNTKKKYYGKRFLKFIWPQFRELVFKSLQT